MNPSAACRVREVAEAAARPLGVERLGFCPLSALSRLLSCRGRGLLPPEGSVILLLLPYYAGDFPGRNLARYALADDYHRIAGEILQSVASALQAAFLAEIVTTLPLPQTGPREGSCGSCRRCLDRCPTGALTAAGLDKSRCRSYITQKKGELTPEEARQIRLGGLAWGCDICTDACPRNARPAVTTIPRLGQDLTPVLTPDNLPALIGRKSYGWRGEGVLRRNLAILAGE